MKIGIITFHRALNYGAVLQAYALQNYLKTLHADSFIIDYRSSAIELFYKPIKSSPLKNTKNFLRECLFFRNNKRKRKKFELFLTKRVDITPKKEKKDLQSLNNDFDCFITGSDQVWNFKWSDFDGAYFLDFANPDKKNSYAASFGVSELPKNLIPQYQKYLSDYNFISVRENDGAKIIENIVGRTPSVLIDPTCLVETKQWEKIAIDRKDDNYVLIYLLEQSEYLTKYAQKLADNHGLKVISIIDSLKKQEGVERRGFMGPDEFLGYFKKAKYVVTNSFHGMVFSVIFRKEFYIQYQKKQNAPNSRFVNFIAAHKLQERVLSDGQEIFVKQINYANVYNIIKEEVNQSYNFLKKMIEYYDE